MKSSYLYRLLQIDHIKKTGDLPNEQQLADSFVFVFHLKGEGRIEINEAGVPLQKETLYICPPYETFGITASSDDVSVFLIRLHAYASAKRHQTLEPDTDPDLFSDIQMMNVHSVGNLSARLQKLFSLWPPSSALQEMKCQLELQHLLYDICSARLFHPADTASAIANTKAYIEEHADAHITLDQLAHMAGISAKHYSETFKKLYGQSVTEFMTETRMIKAKQMMARASYKLREIASQTGYQDEFYFSRTFKKHTGLSPSAYMKKRRKKLAAYGQNTLGQLIPLHLIPYAAPLHPKWTAYYYKHFAADIPVHLSAYRFDEPREENLQILAKAGPELIISMDDVSEEERERLNGIADAVYLPSQEDWRTQFALAAAHVEEEEEARKWLASYERQTEAAKKALQAVGQQRFLFLRLHKHELYLAHNRSVRDVFFGDLGFESAAFLDEPTDRAIPLETIKAYHPDCIMVFIYKEPETIAYYHELQQTSAWQDLKAVREQRVYRIQSDPWREYSACSHERIIRQAVRLLSGKSSF
ncbi:AraC family transcriptional regulator [Bacillus glycinifermentans]|uniref:AraC family transcriptional regulator n=1 Tax=Bacillus glycinifermentans TaxID=1664069 RepID=A0A0J6EPQ4_9BACI|nr:AraC family transcriptional regulator [Bacillus glycinifermentans]ATH93549.1 AraC family transcriptional regulator [Bacillus glycinifermentans]KMM56823.1 AraC family transcriptional regulator [Bacillus glycinifermentans]KRT90283.1 AraC family transcriptional regulator [Bacillus glycinifermentans]MEC0483977.1 AraC family transcriptional regulator [Bacillus glycinifermentans]MEC0492904.1 AraC family transcriptional regulator [Bacillus glycinifermentans]